MEKHFIGPGQDAIREFEQKAQKAMENKANAFRAKFQEILDEIRALNDEKYKIQQSPLTKGELLQLAKAELEKKKKELIPNLLRKHLESCQIKKDQVFSEVSVIAKLFPRNEFWKLFYYLVDEEALKSAVDSLPELGGLSKAARTKRIMEIDQKIDELKSQANTEFGPAVN
jgi:hypothetical protein